MIRLGLAVLFAHGGCGGQAITQHLAQLLDHRNIVPGDGRRDLAIHGSIPLLPGAAESHYNNYSPEKPRILSSPYSGVSMFTAGKLPGRA